MLRLLAAALALTVLVACGDDELDRVDDGVETAPAPADLDVDLDERLDLEDRSALEDDVTEPFVDADDVYDTTPLETEDVESVPVPEVGLEGEAADSL